MTVRSIRYAAAAACLLSAALACEAAAQELDISTPEGALLASRKIQCTVDDGVPVTYSWRGDVLARVPGEPDRLLFKVEGMNVRTCVADEDAQRGKGYRLVSREILLYLDPQTGKPLREWENPWTGETVKVVHVSNDPVNQASYLKTRDGKPFSLGAQVQDGRWWQTITVPLFYTNPLGGDYQDNVGGKYHATEMFNFFGDMTSLTDPATKTAEVQVGWVRMSEWLPWMKMSGRAGLIYMHTAGRKLDRWDEMPAVMKDEIAANYPDYVGPPPLDDTRPNVTSWSFFKSLMESGADQ